MVEPCWTRENALAALRTEALEGSEALFNAVHSPIDRLEVVGQTTVPVNSPTSDRALLDALSDRALRHVFCVVRGEPGSGKSHLIRWLSVNWPHGDDLVMLISRADGSLNGTLRQLKDQLGSRFADLFVGLGNIQNISPEGQARDFMARLANSMRADYFVDKESLHSDWVDTWQIEELLKHPNLQEWMAPRRILATLSGREGERNSQEARFTFRDIIEFVRLGRRAKSGSLNQRPVMVLKKLERELDAIERSLDAGATDDDILDAADSTTENSCRLLEALNDRMRDAVRTLLGITSQGLKELFRRLREVLREQNRRLVLLLEDITSFQGVDDQLIDALVTQSATATNDALCSLISVVGVTPDYYRKHIRAGNILDRISLDLRLGSDGGGFEKLYALQDHAQQLDFAARYLRAVRAHPDALNSWAQTEHDGPPPNTCTSCSQRPRCHAAFGAIAPAGEAGTLVGLFPFTARAIQHMFEVLYDRSGLRTRRTPRGMLQGVLAPTLQRPERLTEGAYPGPEVETADHPDDERRIKAMWSEQIKVACPDDPDTQERMRRLLVWWGDPSAAPHEAHRFHGIDRDVFGAFGLPWLGSDTTEVAAHPPPPPPPGQGHGRLDLAPTDPTPTAAKVGGGLAIAPLGPISSTRPPPPPEPPAVTSKPPTPGRLAPNQFKAASGALARWLEGGVLDDVAPWPEYLFAIVSDLPWRRLDIDPWLQPKLFTKNVVIFEGTRPKDIRYFALPRQEWVKAGVVAYLALRTRDADESEVEFYRRVYVRFLRKLALLAKAHAQRSIPCAKDGTIWRPAAMLTQLLLVRAWLRGCTHPAAPLVDQWSAAIDPEAGIVGRLTDRVESWNNLAGGLATLKHHIDDLRDMLATPQGGAGARGLADVSDVVQALVRLSTQFEMNPAPLPGSGASVSASLVLLKKLIERADDVSSDLNSLPKREDRRIREAVQTIDDISGAIALASWLARVVKVIEGLEVAAPQEVVQAAPNWSKLLARMAELGYEEGGAKAGSPFERADTFIAATLGKHDDAAAVPFLDDEDDEDHAEEDPVNEPKEGVGAEEASAFSPPEVMTWCIQAPATELQQVRTFVSEIDATLERLQEKLEALIHSAGTSAGGGLADVEAFGTCLQTHAIQLQRAAEVKS